MIQRTAIIISFLMLLLAQSVYAQNDKKIFKVVVDAGHGGHDGGARGAYSNEKDLTLAIAFKLGKLINDSLKNTQVAFRRNTDVYHTPDYIPEIANQAQGDLFISIHINSTPFWKERVQTGTRRVKRKRKYVEVPVYSYKTHHTTKANGVETLVLGNIRNNQKGKAIGEYAESITEEPGLLNADDPQTAIIIAQYTKAFLSRSVSLGTFIQEAFAAQGRKDLGVKQQSLAVLAGSYMPGVLVECGFITNPEEEDYMNSEKGQNEIAYAIFKGIKQYRAEYAK